MRLAEQANRFLEEKMEKEIILEKKGKTAIITLNRPEQ